MTSHMTIILQLLLFLNTSFIEHTKCIRKIIIYILVKKPPNLIENEGRKLDKLLYKKSF